MTIFHVLKYNPRAICEIVSEGRRSFDDMLPAEVHAAYNKKIKSRWKNHSSISYKDYIDMLEDALLEYEGVEE